MKAIPTSLRALSLILVSGLSLLTVKAQAANGTWTSLSSGNNWTNSSWWQSGTIADGSGSTAFFDTLDLSANITVNLNGNRTIGNLSFGNLTPSNNYSWAVSGSTLTLAGDTPTLTVGDLGTGTATITSSIAGTAGLTKSGVGTLILGADNSYTGGVNVSQGVLRSAYTTNANAVLGNVAVAAGATWQLGYSTSATLVTGLSGDGTVEGWGTNSRILTLNLSSASTFSGVLKDGVGVATLAITKVGTGDLTLSGPNTFTGALSLNEGKLIANAGALGGAGRVSFNGGTLEVSASGTTVRTLMFVGTGTIDTKGFDLTTGGFAPLSGGTFNKTGSGTLTLGGPNSNLSPAIINVQEGTLKGGANNAVYLSAIHISSGALLDLGGYAYSDGSGVKLNTGLYGAGNVTTTVAGNMNITYGDFAGNLQQGNLQVGNGVNSGTLILSGTNDYAGTTAVYKGTLAVTGSTANSSTYSIFSGAKLQIGNATTTGSISTGAVTNAGTLEFARSNALSFSNLISGAGTVIQSGAGVTTLNGANTYTGVTQITGGTLSASVLNNGGGLNNSSIGRGTTAATSLILNGGTLAYTGGAVSTDRLFSVGTSGGTLDASGSGAVSFANTGSMGFNSQTGDRILTLTGTNAGNNTLAAVIGDNSGATSLLKSGSGTWVLTNANTYTGTTLVTGGSLVLSGGGSIADSAIVDVQSGATLNTTALGTHTFGSDQTVKGNGTITGNTIIEGTLAAGNSPGILTFSNDLTLVGADSVFEIQNTGMVRGTDYDGVNVGGLLTYGGTLTLSMTTLVSGVTYNLFDFGSFNVSSNFDSVEFAGGAYTGTFSYNAGFWTADAGGQVFSFELASGDLILSAIPEPSTTLLLTGALTALVIFRHRRRI